LIKIGVRRYNTRILTANYVGMNLKNEFSFTVV